MVTQKPHVKYIGSLDTVKIHPYVYHSRAAALAACKKAKYTRLCSKKEGEGYERCAAGWYADYKGYWMSKTRSGCGAGRGFRGWGAGKVGAYCCGPQAAAGNEEALLIGVHEDKAANVVNEFLEE